MTINLMIITCILDFVCDGVLQWTPGYILYQMRTEREAAKAAA